MLANASIRGDKTDDTKTNPNSSPQHFVASTYYKNGGPVITNARSEIIRPMEDLTLDFSKSRRAQEGVLGNHPVSDDLGFARGVIFLALTSLPIWGGVIAIYCIIRF